VINGGGRSRRLGLARCRFVEVEGEELASNVLDPILLHK